jgi:hypothetical protein
MINRQFGQVLSTPASLFLYFWRWGFAVIPAEAGIQTHYGTVLIRLVKPWKIRHISKRTDLEVNNSQRSCEF